MRKFFLLATVAVGLSTGSAFGADLRMITKAPPPPPTPVWDIAFGGALMTDYNFRGISQSDRGAAVSAYFEPRFNIAPNIQLYAGIAGTSVKLATDPTAEIDFYGGIRPTFGPVALDFGFIYYYYPNERAIDGVIITAPPAFNTTINDTDFWEVYAKATWTVNPILALGANLYYSPDWLNSGADGTYLSGTVKVTPPLPLPTDWGMYVSGEFGHYWFGRTDFVPGVFVDNTGLTGWDLPDYNYWNLGLGITYKVFTLDLRYHDTNLSRAECNSLTADPGADLAAPGVVINNFTTTGLSRWCNAAFVAKLSFDLTLANLK